jgi:hypothetical protein
MVNTIRRQTALKIATPTLEGVDESYMNTTYHPPIAAADKGDEGLPV